MQLAYDAMGIYMSGSIAAAQGMLRSACRLELDAAAKATDEDQPTRAVLCRSAAILALQGGADEDAARLANLCLHGSLPEHVEDVFRTILDRHGE
jgi:hypothetical protein